jgi:hypothetical protein
MSIVHRIPGRKERVRFMKLCALKGELIRHADVTRADLWTPQISLIRLHIPIVTHKSILFESWGLRGEHVKTHFARGHLYYLDSRKPHQVINHSPLDRIHLVVDVHTSPELRTLMDSCKSSAV